MGVPTYEFEDTQGRYVTRDMPIGTAPKIGETRDGLTRIPSRPLAKVAPNVGFSSISLPLNWPYAPRHDKDGQAVFHSQREVREAVARANNDNEKVVYE
jgi:hypothetical protein